MADNLLNKVDEFLRQNEKLSQMKGELISSLEMELIQVPYDLQKIEISKAENCYERNQVYYPVLIYPEEFTKENESYEKAEHLDVIFHNYILKDSDGRTLVIKEKASLYKELLQDNNGLLISINYITGNVDYCIEIEGEFKYNYHRVFEEDIINQGKNEIFTLKDNFFDNENNQNEKNFQHFLSTIGSQSSLTLLQVMNYKETEDIPLTPTLSARFKRKKNKKKGEVWLKNSKLGCKINAWNLWQVTITVQAHFAFNIRLEKQEFKIWVLEDEEKLRNGISYEEVLNLIKKE